ncbi:MAG: DUF2203 domain-containing protein [Gemmatimonadaceae bacterium]|nr:DUF2203 domain-containing protein [Gemmatimonadaceae bacterium]
MPLPWTLERANAALPYVRRIVADLVAAYARWRETVNAFEVASAGDTAAPSAEALRLQREAQALAREIDHFGSELAALGIQCKSLEIGTVDFPAVLDDAPAYWCWTLGERDVAFWHTRDGGYASRRPVVESDATASG